MQTFLFVLSTVTLLYSGEVLAEHVSGDPATPAGRATFSPEASLIDQAYRVYLGRPADTDGLNHNLKALKSEFTPFEVLTGIAQTPEAEAFTRALPPPNDLVTCQSRLKRSQSEVQALQDAGKIMTQYQHAHEWVCVASCRGTFVVGRTMDYSWNNGLTYAKEKNLELAEEKIEAACAQMRPGKIDKPDHLIAHSFYGEVANKRCFQF